MGGGRAGHLANTRGLVKNERAPFRGSLRLRILHAYARNAQPPAENPAGVNADQAMRVGTARSIAHQAAGFGSFTPGIDRRYPMERRQRDKLYATIEKRARTYQKSVDRSARA
jgi:hypothetical protein